MSFFGLPKRELQPFFRRIYSSLIVVVFLGSSLCGALGFCFMFYVNYVARLYVIIVTLSSGDYQLVFAPLSLATQN